MPRHPALLLLAAAAAAAPLVAAAASLPPTLELAEPCPAGSARRARVESSTWRLSASSKYLGSDCERCTTVKDSPSDLAMKGFAARRGWKGRARAGARRRAGEAGAKA